VYYGPRGFFKWYMPSAVQHGDHEAASLSGWGTGDLLSLLLDARAQDGSPAVSEVEAHDEVGLL